jgi:hypothetical protein
MEGKAGCHVSVNQLKEEDTVGKVVVFQLNE